MKSPKFKAAKAAKMKPGAGPGLSVKKASVAADQRRDYFKGKSPKKGK